MSPTGHRPPATLQHALAALGWTLEAADYGDWEAAMPTLVRVGHEADELAALDEAPPWCDILTADATAEVLAARLTRLLAASSQAGVSALARAAQVDELTGVATRTALMRRLADWLDAPPPGVRALAMLDLDRFKSINDVHGHAVGDEVLRAAGALIGARATERDAVGRLGGDEFVLALARTDEPVLRQELDDLQAALRRIALPAASALQVGASVGVAWVREGETGEDLVRRADALLYRAKAAGRGGVEVDDSTRPGEADPEAELRRFMDVTQVFSERLTQMVHTLSRRLVQGARREALEDRLTGVPNRRYFDERLGRECDQARQHGRALALLFLDLDDFGAINRLHGWHFGDLVLQRFVMLATAGIRLTDWLARWGGEEFCVVMPDTPLDVATEVAERLRAGVAGATLESPDGQRLRLTCSVGVAALDAAGGEEPVALAARAAAASRRAKTAGKNRVVTDGA